MHCFKVWISYLVYKWNFVSCIAYPAAFFFIFGNIRPLVPFTGCACALHSESAETVVQEEAVESLIPQRGILHECHPVAAVVYDDYFFCIPLFKNTFCGFTSIFSPL